MTVSKTMIAWLASLLLASIVCLQAKPAQAQVAAPDVGFYVGLGGGLNMANDSFAQIANAGTTTPTTVHFQNGYNILGALGLKWNQNIRTEVEVAYRDDDVRKIGGVSAGGSQSILSFSGNLLYDFNLRVVTPYLGVGLGAAHNHWGNVATAAANFDGNSMTLQWQLIGGVSVPIAGSTSVFAEYRYIGAGTSNFGSTAGSILQSNRDRSSNVLVGLRIFL